MTEPEFVQTLNLISKEVETAFIVFQSYEGLNHLALTDNEIYAVLNADAMFWQGYRSTLLTTLFMTTSRLFDPISSAITVQTLVTAALGSLHLFSKDALGARKMGNGPKPDWYQDYMASIWVPTETSQLRHLQKALNPHVTRFNNTYLPIRHKIYAHRFMTDEKAGADLFPSTNRGGLGETIDFLQDLVHVIQDLYINGRKPVLGNCDLGQDKAAARGSVERVLRKPVSVSAN